MATTIGRVEYNVVFDGRRTIVQAKAIGDAAGKNLTQQMNKHLTPAFDKANKGMRSLNRESSTFNKHWKSLPHGFRQFVFYATLFTAIAPEIGVLGSAAGGGLTILAGAAFAGAVGIGVFAAALVGLGDDLADLPAEVRPAAQAFQDFKDTLSTLQDVIQAAAAGGIAVAFTSLGATVNALLPTFQVLGQIVGELFATFAQSIAPGTEGFIRLQEVLTLIGPMLPPLIDVIMSLGAALGNIFIVAAPFIGQFLATLSSLVAKFAEWTQSAEGIESLTGWFEQTATLFSSLTNLAGSLGTTLATLVTPELVASFAGFVDQLAAFLPTVGLLLAVVGQLGIFEILGAIFEALGPVLNALLPTLGKVASILGDALVGAIDAIAPALFGLIAAVLPLLDAIAPLIPVILELASNLIQALLPALTPLFEMFTKLIGPIVDIVTVLVQALTPILGPLAEIIGVLLSAALQPLLLLFQGLAWVINLIAPALTILGEIIAAVLGTIVALFTGDTDKIAEIWLNLWNGLPEPLQTWITQTIGMFGDFFTNTFGMFSDFFNNTLGMFGDFFNNTIGMFTDFWNNTVGMFEDFGGHVATAWNNMWQGMSDFVADIWNGILSFIEGGINGVIDLVNGLIKSINTVATAVGLGKIGLIPKVNFGGLRLAAGGYFDQATNAVVGEAGPEVVVPLSRPLGQVDPQVRNLSAILQGKAIGNAGFDTSNGIYVAEGAIQVSGVSDGNLAASATLDRFVALAGG